MTNLPAEIERVRLRPFLNFRTASALSRSTRLVEGGIHSTRRQRGNGAGPRALAAFVQRPQAASSNRRYFYSLGELKESVN
jgi:hypothetical protein